MNLFTKTIKNYIIHIGISNIKYNVKNDIGYVKLNSKERSLDEVMKDESILCPHCNLEHISQKRFEDYGKCISCLRRETIARTTNRPYVKFVDLPEDEKQRLIKQRETNNMCYKKKTMREKKAVNKKTVEKQRRTEKYEEENGVRVRVRNNTIYTPDIINDIKKIANDDISVKEICEKLQKMYPDKGITYGNLSNVISRHSIPHRTRGNIEEFDNVDVKDFDDINDNIESELYLNGETNSDNYTDNKETNSSLEVGNTNSTNSTNNLDNTNDKQLVKLINKNLPERFNKVIPEVEDTLNSKFRREGCQLDKNYTTQDYINAMNKFKSVINGSESVINCLQEIDTLMYVTENGADIINKRKNQQNIINAYQSDALHEAENVIAEDGDTYLSDKLHVIRNYRRYFETDYRNVATLRPIRSGMEKSIGELRVALDKVKSVLENIFNDGISEDTLDQVIANLYKTKNYVENPIFKPLVDEKMIDKYDWVKPIDNTSAKSKISVTHYNPNSFQRDVSNNGRPVTRIGMSSNTPPTSQLTSRVRKSLKIFRVSCRVSGGGYGVFTPWYRDYECTNKDTALSYAKNTLTQLSQTRKGMIWTDLDIVELNVNKTPVQSE